MFEVLNKGGSFMYVLLLLSVACVALVAERVYVLWKKWNVDGSTLLQGVLKFIERDNSYSKALELCGGHPDHPVARVLTAGLVKANQSDKEIERALDEAAVRELPRVLVRTGYVSMIANVATLIGLLGTIFGLIEAFKAVGAASAAMKQEMLAKGISVAMLTTAFGLIVAIPTMIAFSILAARQTKIMDAIEEGSISLFNYLSSRNKKIRELGPEAFAAMQTATVEADLGAEGQGSEAAESSAGDSEAAEQSEETAEPAAEKAAGDDA